MAKKSYKVEELTIDKLVHGGQGMGILKDGRKCFVWGALPGELVKAQITKSKKDWAEGNTLEVLKPSKLRISPQEPDIYLATSPWQILDYSAEANVKQAILAETFKREGLDVNWQALYQDKNCFGYRNKMEYNFWFDNDTNKVSLALHRRGSHLKVAILGSVLASDAINIAGEHLINYINQNNIEARPLKSVILRSDSAGKVGISLFINDKEIATKFDGFELLNANLEIIYSNPKSPASVATQIIKTDNAKLTDKLLDIDFNYTTRSFFQINIPVYEQVLKIIKAQIDKLNAKKVVDLYSGVGSIGLSVTSTNQLLTLIEISAESSEQANHNLQVGQDVQIITTEAEKALDYLDKEAVIIVDPPRAGLHKEVTNKLIELKPTCIIYLSCDPSTQARDIKMLVDGAGHKIQYAQGFNFFPRTPHIESLAILRI
jgi:23S rRNA (uracil1939-C5)-methyltransferase